MKHISSKFSQSYLSDYNSEVDVQPNATDVRLDKVFVLDDSAFIIDEDTKTHRNIREMQPNADGYFVLTEGVYSVIMKGTVTLSSTEAGFIITRSTLNRNGVHITTGLYDSGYSGVMAATLHVTCGMAKIKKDTRIGQFLLFEAEALHKYDGSYGENKEHDKKYGR